MEKLKIESSAFGFGDPIPEKFTQFGENLSPPIEITNIPKGTKSIVLVCVDPDAPDPAAPKLTFVHWVVYNLPAKDILLSAGADIKAIYPQASEGLNGRGTAGYIGPRPPIGTHRYFFKAFAVDSVLEISHTPELKDVYNHIDGHVVQMAETMGTFKAKG